MSDRPSGDSLSVYAAHEQAWKVGTRPDIAVAATGAAQDDQCALVKMDMEYRIQAGERIGRVTVYRAVLPAECFNRLVPELYLWEYQLLSALPQPITRDAYLAAYPDDPVRPSREGLKSPVVCTNCPKEAVANEEIDSCPDCRAPFRVKKRFPEAPGYEITAELGRGGMGVVYKATEVLLRRVVALKMIRAGSHAGAHELARFRAEAEAVASLQHPNIVQIFNVGEHDGRPYIALEFVAGGSLKDKAAGAPQPAAAAAQMVETLARAMHVAHGRNIVHRDLKPANVLLTADGVPKITDFGLAKQLDSDAGLTATGAVLGTPNYMAPEQADEKVGPIGPLTDVYALGAILYELLTGHPPYWGESDGHLLAKVANLECHVVAPRRVRGASAADPILEAICLKCLEKVPGRRYASAADLAADLRRFLDGKPTAARPRSPLWRLFGRHARGAALDNFARWRPLMVFVAFAGLAENALLYSLQRFRAPPWAFHANGVMVVSLFAFCLIAAWRALRRRDTDTPREVFFVVFGASWSTLVITVIVNFVFSAPGEGYYNNLGWPFGCICNSQAGWALARRLRGWVYAAPVGFLLLAGVTAWDQPRAPLWFAFGWFAVFLTLAVRVPK